MRSADTSAEAHAVQVAAYRSMSPERRLTLGAAMSEDALAVMEAGIKVRHPDYDDAAAGWALRRLRLGDDLFRRVWPDAPLVAP